MRRQHSQQRAVPHLPGGGDGSGGLCSIGLHREYLGVAVMGEPAAFVPMHLISLSFNTVPDVQVSHPSAMLAHFVCELTHTTKQLSLRYTGSFHGNLQQDQCCCDSTLGFRNLQTPLQIRSPANSTASPQLACFRGQQGTCPTPCGSTQRRCKCK